METQLPFEVLGFDVKRKIIILFKDKFMLFSVNQLNRKELSLLMEFSPNEPFEIVVDFILNEAHSEGLKDIEDLEREII